MQFFPDLQCSDYCKVHLLNLPSPSTLSNLYSPHVERRPHKCVKKMSRPWKDVFKKIPPPFFSGSQSAQWLNGQNSLQQNFHIPHLLMGFKQPCSCHWWLFSSFYPSCFLLLKLQLWFHGLLANQVIDSKLVKINQMKSLIHALNYDF